MELKDLYLVGVDIGTGNLKSIIVRGDGTVVGSSSQELTTSYLHPGWTEQDPNDWYLAFCKTFHEALNQAKISTKKINAVCIDAAAHTPVLLDENDEILRPAILWTDQRSVKQVEWLNKHYGDRIFQIGYQRANPTWTLPQLLWVRECEPEVFQKTRKLMIAKDYLRFRVTGSWETDWVDALGTLMLDAGKRQWSKELCGYIGWPMDTLPKIVSPREVVGKVSRQASRDTGLQEGTPVVAGSSDTAVEDYGAGAVEAGQGIIKLATAGNTNIMTDKAYPHPLTFTYYHIIPGLWYSVAATNSCASAHRWLRDQFFKSEMKKCEREKKGAFDVMDEIAKDVPVGSNGLIFHPYLLGERSPYWDPFLKADFIGITMRHQRQHFVRALYEGIAFSLKDCLNSILSLGLDLKEARIIGGGSRSALWRQIVCDVLGVEVLKPAIDDASYGAALLGGVGVGIFQDEKDAIHKCVKIVSHNKPDPRNHETYTRLFDVYRKAHDQLVEVCHELHEFS
jgi:xylulokinase